MKHQIATRTLFIYFFALLIVFISGCDKDDDVGNSLPEQEYDRLIKFEVSTPLTYYKNTFVMATDETGHVHYDAVFTSLDTSLLIPIVGDHTIDVTVGFKGNTGYHIRTFIDVADKFDMGIPRLQGCDDEFYSDGFGERIDVEVNNIQFEKLVQSGSWFSFGSEQVVSENKVELRQILLTKDHLMPDRSNHLICLQDSRYDEPRCITVNAGDVNDGKISLNFEDFFVPELRSITVNEFTPEDIRVKVKNGNKTLYLAFRNEPLIENTADRIDVYAPVGMQPDETIVISEGRVAGGRVEFKHLAEGWPNEVEYKRTTVESLEHVGDSAHVAYAQTKDLISLQLLFPGSVHSFHAINKKRIDRSVPEFSPRIKVRFPDLIDRLSESFSVIATSYDSDEREIQEFRTPSTNFLFWCTEYDSYVRVN